MNNKFLYVILVVVLGVLGFEGYFMYNNYQNNKINDNGTIINNDTNKDNSANEQLDDKVKLVDTKKENDKIVQEYEIVLNGKKNTMNLEFNYNEYEDHIMFRTDREIDGNYKDYNFYSSYVESINEFTEEKVNEDFNENNFYIIRGEDQKNYLLILDDVATDYGDNLNGYLFNDKLELITKNLNNSPYNVSNPNAFNILMADNVPCKFASDVDPLYKKAFNRKTFAQDGFFMKIENNKIYYLIPIFDENSLATDTGILEERVYTIKDNKLSYEVINTYQITGICQKI